MQIQPLGYLSCKLYRLGWQNALHGHLSRLQHWLLSIFLYYRRGFAEGCEWVEEYRLKSNS